MLFNAPVYAKVTSGRDRVNKTTATATAIKDINDEPDLSRNTTALDRTDSQWEKTSETKLTASVPKRDQSTEKLLILIKRYKTCAHFFLFIVYFIVKTHFLGNRQQIIGLDEQTMPEIKFILPI